MRLEGAGMREPETETREMGEPDMINLLTLNEHTILENLERRYEAGQIYTYTGSILVVLNPYTMFNIYGLDTVKCYNRQPMTANPPHLFAVGNGAYSQMLRDVTNQVIVISGESGAGKTESMKLIMQYLAAVNQSHDSTISDRILEANPLLESFGNAKTTRNDNSSRFGKYVEVYFKGPSIVGAKTSEYLLEKSRIVSQTHEERNYHVFYEMFAGFSERERQSYGLTEPQSYHYLNQGGDCGLNTQKDLHHFLSLRSSMDVLGFKVREQTTIFRILAAVLHLGNVNFTKMQNEYQNEGVTIAGDCEISWVCRLLELSQQWLKQSLTCKVTEARQERMFSPLTIEQAQGARDAVAKALYQSLFTWLVRRTNQVVNYRTEHRSKARTTSIAILDIFGFEDLKINTFEQLCINYANESLQFYFTCHIFKLEQQEYAKEQIQWTNIDYYDNQPTIDLIAKKPNGIFHILDDESHFPKGTDYSFLDKCHFEHSSHPSYDKPRMSGPEFYIRHFAGTIKYNVRHVCEKNKDTLRGDVVQLLIQSNNHVISQMFRELRDNSVTKTISKTTGFYVTAKPKTPTVAASFNESLVNLIDTMSRCQPWFVRCIKPNHDKAPLYFSRPVVLSQLRHTGMLETIRIRKAGYPSRYTFTDFTERYSVLVRARPALRTSEKHQDLCHRILSSQGYRWMVAWQLGTSKVFLKESLASHLEQQKSDVTDSAILDVQRAVRGFVARARLHELKCAAIRIQAEIRGWRARLQYQKMVSGFIKLQALYRMIRQKRIYRKELATSYWNTDVHDRQMDRLEWPAEDDRKEAGSPQWTYQSNTQQERMVRSLGGGQVSQGYGSRPLSHPQAHSHHAGRPPGPTQEVVRPTQAGPTGQSNVARLEIPAELAYVYSKLDGWEPPHSDRQLVSTVGRVTTDSGATKLPDDINAYAFSKFVSVYFNKDVQMYVRREPISDPFLPKSSHRDNKESLAIFKLVLRFMNDAAMSVKQEQVLGAYIVQTALSNVALRDEVYVQLCNQVYENGDVTAAERGWLLVAACLCCFPPTEILAKYLLKFVSDQGHDGYKAFCQHKLLQCLHLGTQAARVYPPTLLEWKACRKKASMALEGEFSDEHKVQGQVESWDTAEEYAACLLGASDIEEETFGWTVAVREDSDLYEASGHDYVLDFMSEMETPPGFPYNKSYYLASSDRRDPGSARRDVSKDGPHTADHPRPMSLDVEELRTPIPVEPRPPLKPALFFRYSSLPGSNSISGESWYQTREEMLSASKLNVRPELRNVPAVLRDLSESKLNMRYTAKKPAPPPPPHPTAGGMTEYSRQSREAVKSPDYNPATGYSAAPRSPRVSSPEPGYPEGFSFGPRSPTGENDTKVRVLPSIPPNVVLKKRPSDSGASKQSNMDTSRLPVGPPTSQPGYGRKDQYQPVAGVQNGYVPNGDLLGYPSDYRVSSKPGYPAGQPGHSPTHSDGMSDGNTLEIEQWLDQVFDPVLDGNMGSQSDAQSLSHRLKGSRKKKGITSMKTHGKKQDPMRNVAVRKPEKKQEVDEMQRWLDGVFSSVLEYSSPVDEGVYELGGAESPSHTLHRRLKGGGETLKQQQPIPSEFLGGGATSLALGQYTVPAPMLTSPAQLQIGPIPPVSLLPDYTTQLAQQQAIQLQAQQQARIQATLQTQQLENQYLQHKLQAEILKQQIHQMEGVGGQERAAAVAPPPPSALKYPQANRVASPTQSVLKYAHTHSDRPPIPQAESSQRSSATFSSDDDLDLSQGEVDKSRPGGVKTLLRGYEVKNKSKTPVTPELYNPPRNQAVIANRTIVQKQATSPAATDRQATSPTKQTSVKFSETVEQIPRKDSMSPRQPASAVPPPPPPPPPPPVEQTSVSSDPRQEAESPPPPLAVSEVIVKDMKRQGIGKVVRIGKVTWPPKQDEVEKETLEPGKLEITERQRLEGEKLTAGPYNAQQKIQDMINASKEANRKPAPARKPLKSWEKGEEPVVIDMKARQKQLEEKFSKIHSKQEDETQTVVETQATGTGTEVDTQTQTEEVPEPFQTAAVQTVEGDLEPSTRHRGSQVQGQPVHVFYRGDVRDVQTQTQYRGDRSTPPPPPLPPPPPQEHFQKEDEERESVDTPVPPIELPSSEDEMDVQPADLRALEKVKTRLFPKSQGPYYTYVRVPWKLEVRKEVFTPTETTDNVALMDLIFTQIVQDVYSDTCLRIMKDDKLRMKSMLESQGVTPHSVLTSGHKISLMKQVIDIGREWPFYFSRLFAVNGGRAYPGVHYLGVSHSGLSFIAREKDLYDDQLNLLESVRFEDVVDVSVPRADTLQLHLADERYIMLYSPHAEKMKTMIEAFCIELEKEQMYVQAVKDYHTRDSTLLNFRSGDVIKLTNKDMMLHRGWLYGSLQGRAGMFPEEYVTPLARHEIPKSNGVKEEEDRVSMVSAAINRDSSLGQYPMLEFAMLYYRDSPYKYEMVRGGDGSIHGTFRRVSTMKARSHGDKAVTKDEWQQQLDMIRWTSSPIQASLLRFDAELNKEALENFIGLMRFMGDYPPENGTSLTGLIDHMLLQCKNHPELRDEIYCQLAKQTCDNKSTKKSSNTAGWRLMLVLSAFFDCSDQLKPYLVKYLEENAYDTSREYHLIAEQCLQNLRHTFKYGGRKNTPNTDELMALSNGRTLKHLSCLLSGGVSVIINVKSCTVVSECIDQVCSELDIMNELEREEYTLFWVIEGEHRFCPLANDDYIIDVTTELNRLQSQYYLLFQRTSWVFPLHLGSNSLYVDCMYNQIRPEYDEGNFFYVSDSKLLNYKKDEIAVLTAFLFIIALPHSKGTPQQKELKELMPKLLGKMSDTGLNKWTTMVSDKLSTMGAMTQEEAKARFLDVLTRWPFFGSTFFNIKSAKGPGLKCEEALLAINRQGVHILEKKTHKSIQTYLYEHLLTSRRHTDEKGHIYLDLKHGDLRTHEITTLETDNATAVNTLISQYFKIVRSYKAEIEDALPRRPIPTAATNGDMSTSF